MAVGAFNKPISVIICNLIRNKYPFSLELHSHYLFLLFSMIEYVYLFTHFIEQLSKSKSSGKWQSPNFHKGLYDPLLWGGGSPSQIHWIFLSPSNPLWEARPLSCVEIFSSSCRVFVLIAGHPTKIQSYLFASWTLSGHFCCLNLWSFGNVILDWVRKIFEYFNLCGLEISLCAGKAEKLTCSFGGL